MLKTIRYYWTSLVFFLDVDIGLSNVSEEFLRDTRAPGMVLENLCLFVVSIDLTLPNARSCQIFGFLFPLSGLVRFVSLPASSCCEAPEA